MEHSHTGLKVIAVGGDKLARGLTLEGLCISYFLRSARMYDTLMQMGRWFGYRPGYLDLCRLYTTSELAEWFGHITDAAEELREEFDLMVASGATPKQYGLKVQSHPVLMVTSRIKMRAAKSLMLSFSGQVLETTALFRDTAVLRRNLNATQDLVASLGEPERQGSGAPQMWSRCVWRDVSHSAILDFLSRYRTHPDAYKVSSPHIAEFIQSMASHGELTRWTVALIGGGAGEALSLRPDLTVSMLTRRSKSSSGNRYSIGRLLSPPDEAIDLNEAGWTPLWSSRARCGSPTLPGFRMAGNRKLRPVPQSAESGVLEHRVCPPGRIQGFF